MVRVGVVGAGTRSESFAGAFRKDPRAALTGVYDPGAAAAERFAAAHGVETVAESYEQLLERVDLVVLTSPIPDHGPQACRALERGVHVLSEVPATGSLEQAQELVAAVRASSAVYGLAENYAYLLPNLIVRELARAGDFGELFLGEHDLYADYKPFRFPDGTPRWTYDWWAGRDGDNYPTHSLGPLLQWFEHDRVVAVSCHGTGRHTAPEHEMQDVVILLARTLRGKLLKLTFSWIANSPFVSHYTLQGTAGRYDGGDPVRQVEPVVFRDRATGWEPLLSLADRFLPARYRDGVDLSQPAYGGAYLSETSDLFMIREFLDAVIDGTPFAFDVHAGLDMSLPGLMSETSIAQNGAWIHVPNSRLFTAGITTAPGTTPGR